MIRWLIDENYNVIAPERKLKNYTIWTPDDIVEVLSDEEPIVEWI